LTVEILIIVLVNGHIHLGI